MPSGYRHILNSFGLAQVAQVPIIPDARLMVGAMETLQPVPLFLYDNALPVESKPVINSVNNVPAEHVAEKFTSSGFKETDFPINSHYMGEPVNGG